MSTITKNLQIFFYNGADLTLATAPWKNKVNKLFRLTDAGNAWQSFVPSSGFNAVTKLVAGSFYFCDANTLPFDIDGAALTMAQAPANTLPVANAGADLQITLPTNQIVLMGSGTDSDGTITGYAWAQVTGPNSATLASPNAQNTTVTGLIQGVYLFRLTVTDNSQGVKTDDVLVTVNGVVPTSGNPANVVLVGNSNVEGTYGNSITATLPGHLGNAFSVVNKGKGGSEIDGSGNTMDGRFADDITATHQANASRNVLVGMEGTNSDRDSGRYPTPRSYVDAVKAYCLRAKNAGYEVIWVGTLPNTVVAGTNGNTNTRAQAENALLAAELPAIGVRFRGLTNTLIGQFGTADWGDEPAYSSYRPNNGSLLTTPNPYYSPENPDNQSLHLNGRGCDILARVMADEVLYLTTGASVPDRSNYGTVVAPIYENVVWRNATNGMQVNGNTLTQLSGDQWTQGASGTRGFGASTSSLKGRIIYTVNGGEIFMGVSAVDSAPDFASLLLGVWHRAGLNGEPGSLIYWESGTQLEAVGQWVGGEELTLDIYDTYVQLRRADGSNIGAAHAITLPDNIGPDTSFGFPGGYFGNVRIEGPNLIDL